MDLPSGGRVLDLGCGAGDHLFYALRTRPDARGAGLDRSDECIALCRSYADTRRIGAEFIQSDLDDTSFLPASDLILCITVLQYVDDDSRLLRLIKSTLSVDGRLLLYSPVRNERLTRLYSKWVEGTHDEYDARQSRRRVYGYEELRRKVERAGFEIERIEQAYGTFGKIYYEVFETLVYLSRRPAWRYTAPILLALASPLLATLMMLDFLRPVSRGNGVVIVAR